MQYFCRKKPQKMPPPDKHSNFDPFQTLRRDRDRWAQLAMEQAEYIRLLEQQVITLKKQLEMKDKRTPTQAPVINVAGNFIDIHDNEHCNIYATEPKQDENKPAETPYLPPLPPKGDYNAVREYIAERKKYDEEFRIYWDSHNLKQNCTYLTTEFGWIVDDHSLGTNLNRHR